MKEKDLRAALVGQTRSISERGLGERAAAVISARIGRGMLITPAARRSAMRADAFALMRINGEYGAWSGRINPSDEWRLHLDVMRAHPHIGAIVHCRPTYATALSMLRAPIPAVHYRIAAFGGLTIPCAAYAPYGTKELAERIVGALRGRSGALIAHHGMIATGGDLDEAMARAAEIESLAKMYCVALAAGRPSVLPDAEVTRLIARLKAPAPAPITGAKEAPRKKGWPRKGAAKPTRRVKKAR
jgi:L-fuculose-phosphate aldolase